MLRSPPRDRQSGLTDNSFELDDLVADIGETTNLATQQPERVPQLGQQLIEWLDETNAPLATLRDGQSPRVLENFNGETYANGAVTQHRGDTITIAAGDQVPFILPKAAEPTVAEPFIPGAPTSTVNGAAVAGRTVHAVPGTWPSGTTVTYQWYADDAPLTDGRSATLAVPRAAVGKTLRVVDSGWTPGAKVSNRWRIGAKVTVKARPSLKLRHAHLGKRVRLAVVVTKAGHTTVSGTSARTAKVARR